MEGETMTETERILREQFPGESAHITLCFGEARRTAKVEEQLDREDIRRAAEGRMVLAR